MAEAGDMSAAHAATAGEGPRPTAAEAAPSLPPPPPPPHQGQQQQAAPPPAPVKDAEGADVAADDAAAGAADSKAEEVVEQEEEEFYIGALDQGTTSTRFVLFDRNQVAVAQHQLEHQQFHPQPGWCEHDPMELLENARLCMQHAVAKLRAALREAAGAGAAPPDLDDEEEAQAFVKAKVRAIGITNQRETTVVWERRTGRPLHRAIVWLDLRTQAIADRLAKKFGPDAFRKTCGLPINSYFSALKLRWLLENDDAVARAASEYNCCFGTVDTWLIYNLTGGRDGGAFVTDITNASRTMLMSLYTLQWDEASCARLGIYRSMLPRIASNAEKYGVVTEGTMKGVPICGCLGDQHAALLGQRCLEGQAKNTYGTGCFLLMNTGEQPIQSYQGLLTTTAFQLGPRESAQYALEGSVAIAGAGVNFLKDNLHFIEEAHEIEELASSVESSAGVTMVPALSGLFAPHWEEAARGTLFGMTQFSTKAHVARALLEGIAQMSREVLDAMQLDASGARVAPLSVLKVDGGASRNALLMQLQADALGLPIERPEYIETTALGAALAAGLGSGAWTMEQVLGDSVPGTCKWDTFQPSNSEEQRDVDQVRWQLAVKSVLQWARDTKAAAKKRQEKPQAPKKKKKLRPPKKYSTTTKVLCGLLVLCNLDHLVKVPAHFPILRRVVPSKEGLRERRRRQGDPVNLDGQAALGLAMNLVANTVIFTVPNATRGLVKALLVSSIQSVRSTLNV